MLKTSWSDGVTEGGDEPRNGDGSFSLSVSRSLQILGLFSPERTEFGIAELSRDLRVPKSNIQRLVRALCRHEFLDQNPTTRKYRIGIGAFQVGGLFVNSRTIEQTAEPFMRDLVAELGHTCHISVLRDCFMIVTASIEGPGPIKFSAPVGSRLPLHASAVGKAALSTLADGEVDGALARAGMAKRTPHSIVAPAQLRCELEFIRSRGYSVNWEENRPGVGSVAAPVLRPDGALAAVLSIGFPISFVLKADLPDFGAALIAKARALADKLGYAAASRPTPAADRQSTSPISERGAMRR